MLTAVHWSAEEYDLFRITRDQAWRWLGVPDLYAINRILLATDKQGYATFEADGWDLQVLRGLYTMLASADRSLSRMPRAFAGRWEDARDRVPI